MSRHLAWLPLGAALSLGQAPSAQAAAAAPQVRFAVPAGPLDRALLTFAAQAKRQILFDRELTAGRRSIAVTGAWDPDAALERLIAGAGIVAVQSRPGVTVLKRAPASASTEALADDASPDAGAPAVQSAAFDTVVVIGTLIRGGGDSASPTLDLTRESFDRLGQATIAEALQSLPQTFGGSATPQTSLIGSDGLATNFSASTGVNLRGLGANSTLVLVNGRRLAGSGLRGDFGDVSAIPTAAVDRVEVLLDGASALYGSDAVGGVVNILLRQRFDGVETRLRTGGATQGGAQETLIGQTFGKSWATGRLLFSYEYESRGDLAASDRNATRDADLRSLGGTDHRLIYSHPGNILAINAAGTAYVPAFAIPPGQNGTSLRPQDFIAGAGNLENYRALGDILPDLERNSGYLSLAQDVTSRIHLSLDARYTRRRVAYAQPAALTVLQVTPANPFFVSPSGARSLLIGYGFGDELGPVRDTGVTQNAGVTAGATFDLGRTWALDVYGAWAETRDKLLSSGLLNSGFLNEALGSTPDNPATPYSAARDGYFNPFGDGGANGAAVLDFIGSGYNRTETRSRVQSLDLKADGTLFSLPGGEVRMALGGQFRREDFKVANGFLLSGVRPGSTGGLTFSRQIAAGFAELRIPLVGPANALPGVERLELSLAGRIENYDDVGLSGDPKLGLIWTPVRELRLRATYGTSFRAPALPEIFALRTVSPTFLSDGSQSVLALVRYGGGSDLTPEHATTWTVGADWSPPALRGLKLSATGFDIAYDDRIGQPLLENLAQALSDPSYSSFVQRITPSTNAADLAAVNALLAQASAAAAARYPATGYGAIVDARYVNTASLHLRGLDASATYALQRGADRFDLGLNVTYLAEYARRLTPTAAEADLAGTPGQPARLRLRGVGSWSRGDYGATLSVAHTSGSRPLAGPTVDGFTTVDAQLLWRPQTPSGPLHGVSLALNVSNLLDQDPPFYDSPNGVGYDPANADVVGRTLSVQLTKRW